LLTAIIRINLSIKGNYRVYKPGSEISIPHTHYPLAGTIRDHAMQKVDETKRALRATNIPDHPIAISSNLKEDGCNTAVGPGNQVWIIFSGLCRIPCNQDLTQQAALLSGDCIDRSDEDLGGNMACASLLSIRCKSVGAIRLQPGRPRRSKQPFLNSISRLSSYNTGLNGLLWHGIRPLRFPPHLSILFFFLAGERLTPVSMLL
jgi:hypothetical protein